jgi:hypothetical protein
MLFSKISPRTSPVVAFAQAVVVVLWTACFPAAAQAPATAAGQTTASPVVIPNF